MKLNYILLYINENLRFYIILSCLFTLYLITFLLFNIPVSVIFYPTVIFLVIFFFYSVLNYRKWKEKIQSLEYLQQTNIDEILELLQLISFKNIENKELIKIINKISLELEIVQVALKSKSREMEDYITTWIHQIKIPITSMRLILDDMDSESGRQLKSDLLRIELYVEMVLTYFRLESSTTDYVFTKVNLDKLIKNEVKKFAGEFIKRRIHLDLKMNPVKITSDEKWLSFVLDQLLSNALKYTSYQGNISIELNEKSLCICDNGIGIAKSDLPRIFERGYTGINGRKDKRASGLGLFLVKQVCENLKLPINIQSEPNKGTQVCLTLTEKNNLFE